MTIDFELANAEHLTLRQHLPRHILDRQQRRTGQQVQRPRNAHGRIVPGQAALELRGVVIGGLVQEVRRVAGDQKAVGKARRNPELAVVLFGQFDPDPLAEGRGGLAQIHCHVEHRAAGDPHQLALGLLDLIVQTPQHAFARAGVVVLHEVRAQPGGVVEDLGVVTFHEEATGVAEHLGFEDQQVRDRSLDDFHRNPLS